MSSQKDNTNLLEELIEQKVIKGPRKRINHFYYYNSQIKRNIRNFVASQNKLCFNIIIGRVTHPIEVKYIKVGLYLGYYLS